MTITVRTTVQADLPAIIQIENDPQVSQHQYRRRLFRRHWSEQLVSATSSLSEPGMRCSTVLFDGRVAGHITHYHFQQDRLGIAYCGWNLAPTYWGQGIMVRSLKVLFQQFFESSEVDLIVAECFRDNRRCKRLLERLSFQMAEIPWSYRIQNAIQEQSLRWIQRFQLREEEWRSKRQATNEPHPIDEKLTEIPA